MIIFFSTKEYQAHYFQIENNKKSSYFRNCLIQRAKNGTRTRDPQLGKLMLSCGIKSSAFDATN